jgi:hypothetical protein
MFGWVEPNVQNGAVGGLWEAIPDVRFGRLRLGVVDGGPQARLPDVTLGLV